MDKFLESEGSQGTYQSEGRFTIDLQRAGEKLAQHGLDEQDLWTLKLAQAFCLLECKVVQVSLRDHLWRFEIDSQAKPFRLAEFQSTTPNISEVLSSDPEHYLAVALAVMSHGKGRSRLVGAEWHDGQSALALLGKVDNPGCSGSFRGLVLSFCPESGAWKFPFNLWAERLYCSPVEFWNVGPNGKSTKRHLINHSRAAKLVKKRQGTALAYLFSDPADTGFVYRPMGRALCDLVTKNPPRKGALTTVVRTKTDSAIGSGSLLVLVRDSEKRITTLQALKAGCLLEKQRMPTFPRGFEIIFQANDCPTDLSQMRLRESPEFAAKQALCLEKMLLSLRYLESSIDTDMTHIPVPQTPLLARLTVATGMGIGGSLSLLCLFFASPLAAAICSVIWVPSGFLHLFSKHSRKMEFQQAKMDGMAVLRSRLTNTESVLRNWGR